MGPGRLGWAPGGWDRANVFLPKLGVSFLETPLMARLVLGRDETVVRDRQIQSLGLQRPFLRRRVLGRGLEGLRWSK